MYCKHCAHEVNTTDKFCGNCGTRLECASTSASDENASSSNEMQQKLKILKTKWDQSLSKMGAKRKNLGRKPIRNAELRVRILDKNMRMVQRGFKDDSGALRGYIQINVSSTSTYGDWAEEISSNFNTTDIGLTALVSTRKGDYTPIKPNYSFKDLRDNQKERKISSKKFGIFFKINKARSSIVGLYKQPKTSSKASEQSEGNNTRSSSEDDDDFVIDLEKEEEDKERPSGVATDTNDLEESKSDTSSKDGDDMPTLASPCDRIKRKVDTTDGSNSDLEDPAIIEVTDKTLIDEMASYDKLMRKKRERQAMAESIEIYLSGKETKQICVVYPAHGGMAFEREFALEDSLKSIYTWLCCEIEADVLPPKFRLECRKPDTCNDDDCQHSYPLTSESALRSRIASLPETVYIVEEDYSGNDTMTLYDDVLFS